MKATFVSEMVFCRCQVFWTYLFGDPEIGPHREQNDGTFTVAGPVRTKSLFVKIFYQNHLEPVPCEHSLRKVGCKLICGDNGLKTASIALNYHFLREKSSGFNGLISSDQADMHAKIIIKQESHTGLLRARLHFYPNLHPLKFLTPSPQV